MDTNLIGTHHVLIKNFTGDLVYQRVGDPSAIMAVGDFSKLIHADLIHGDLICFLVTFDGDLGGHSTNGSDLAPENNRQGYFDIFHLRGLLVTGLNQQADIGRHKADFHCDVLTVGKNSIPIGPALLNEAKDVIPPAMHAMSHMLSSE